MNYGQHLKANFILLVSLAVTPSLVAAQSPSPATPTMHTPKTHAATTKAIAKKPTSRKTATQRHVAASMSGAKLTIVQPKPARVSPAKPDESPVNVTVRTNSEVGGRTFTLGEIAEFNGKDKALIDRLSAVEVGASPLPGLSRILYPGDVVVRLRAGKLDSKRLQIMAPPTIRVTSLGFDIPAEKVMQAALAAGKDAVKNMPDAVLEPVPLAGRITVPVGRAQFLAGTWQGRPEQGTLSVPVSIVVDGKPSRIIEVTLRVRHKTMVLVTVRQVAGHAVLTADDVALKPMDLPPGSLPPLTVAADAIGKRAVRPLPPDTPISAGMLETPPAVQANDKVLIEYVSGVIHISAPGIARQTGAVGDTIRVYESDTRTEVDAVIVDSTTVRITERDPDRPKPDGTPKDRK